MIGIKCKTAKLNELKKGDKILYSGPSYSKSDKDGRLTVKERLLDLPLGIYYICDFIEDDYKINMCISKNHKLIPLCWIKSENAIVLIEED